jgi:hypothetical protein
MAKGREPNWGTEPAKKTKVLDAKKFADFMILTRREAQAHLELAKRTMKKFYDEGRQHEEFEEGDTVWINASDIVTGRPKKKLDWKRLGPYSIIKKLSPTAYQLLLPRNFKIHNVFHISKLQQHIPNTFDWPKPWRVTLNIRGGDWEPENILMDRLNDG